MRAQLHTYHIILRVMARYLSVSEAASLVFDERLLDSEDESDIEEDPTFPLPGESDETAPPSLRECAAAAPPSLPHPSCASVQQQPLPPCVLALAQELEIELNPGTGGFSSPPVLPTESQDFAVGDISQSASGVESLPTSSASSVPPIWEPVDSASDVPPPQLPFGQLVGSSLRLPQDSQPVDFFRHLLDDHLMDQFVKETNVYARDTIDKLTATNRLRPHSILHKWQPVTPAEMEGFLAIILNMGLIDVPSIQDYWSTAWISQLPFFSSLMTRERFQLVFWLLHVGHLESNPPRRIDKVKAFLEPLLANSQSSYNPSREVAVDETMIGFRGRFGPRHYMPNKPTKYGIKAFTMADSAHGYMLDILVYTGSDTLTAAREEYTSLPQPARAVLQVARKYLDKGYHIFTDRYYTSIPLANALYQRTTVFTGTCMRNRVGLPQSIRRKTRLADNEVKAFRDSRMMALEWRAPKSKSSVVMLSTESSAAMMRIHLSSNRGEVQKPQVVNKYNHSMNGVDRADQNSVYYSFIRKSRKWWRKLFFWLVEVTVVNSFILYKLHSRGNVTHLQYRRHVIEALAIRFLHAMPPRARPGRPRKRPLTAGDGDSLRLNGKRHFPEKSGQLQDCAICSDRKNKRHRTLYYCKTCPTNPPLCVTPCFEKYHTLQSYN